MSKKKAAAVAALLCACIHPAFFDSTVHRDETLRSQLHGADGIVQSFLAVMKAAGKTSARVGAMVAMQLCSLLLRQPELMPLYTAQVRPPPCRKPSACLLLTPTHVACLHLSGLVVLKQGAS